VQSTLFGEPSKKNTQVTNPLPNDPGRFYRYLVCPDEFMS
jgi:hypothetical protein